MKQRPVFLTQYALARLLKEFAQQLGLSEVMADVAAQVHLQSTGLHLQWTDFISHNCANCQKSPESCEFLNPKESNCAEGATPGDVKSANAIVIERGMLEDCPSRVDHDESRISG